MGANVFTVKGFQLFHDGSVRRRLDESCNVKIFKRLCSVESYQSYFLYFRQFFFCAELWVVMLALGFGYSHYVTSYMRVSLDQLYLFLLAY